MKKKCGFTLAVGATHRGRGKYKKMAFTLAEVLITLAIIGVVAAMTIPTLIAKINSIVTDNQQKVFNAKIIKGLNLTKTAGDLNNTYTSTYDFLVNGLGKNLKMAKVCDKDHIRDCIPYDKIKYDNNGTEETVDVADLKTAGDLQIENTNGTNYNDTAAFVLADGTPVIVSYNKECIDDPDKADTSINLCLAGIYDLNGSRKPNKYGVKVVEETTSYTNDLIAFNGASIGSSCAGQIGDVCLASTAVKADNAMLSLIQAVDPSYTMPTYSGGNDYWQLANDYCDKVQNGAHLLNADELTAIAKALYNDSTLTNSYKSDLSWEANKSDVFAALGIESTASWFALWSPESRSTDLACWRYFHNTYTLYGCNSRFDDGPRAVCIGD